MADEYNYKELDALIGQFFSINNMTYGDDKQPFIVRYRGFLKSNNSLSAYEAIEQALTAHHLVPVLRRENEEHVIFLVPEKQKSKPLKAKINLILFVLTLVSVLATGGLYGYEGAMPDNPWQALWLLINPVGLLP